MTDGAPQDFQHEALFYAGHEEFLEGAAAFVTEGVEAGEAVLALLTAPKATALREELNGATEGVRFAHMDEMGANPARIIPAWRAFVRDHSGGGRRVRGIGEPISPERSGAELVECQRHESLLNLAFADTTGFRLLCPYDTSALDPDVLEEARRSHPVLTRDGLREPSAEYRPLDEVAAPFAARLPEPRATPDSRVFQAGTLGALRRWVAAYAQDAGLSGQALDDAVVAVNEVASNSVVHGGGGGVLRVWSEDDKLIFEVNDRGAVDLPLAGRERPAPLHESGWGLWLANQLCDLVQIRTFANGNAVRVHVNRT